MAADERRSTLMGNKWLMENKRLSAFIGGH
jgi:hypothetical protein